MEYKVIIPKFITHIPKTNNKVAPNKYIKINNQLIYNSNLNRFARNIVINNMHNYLINYIKENNLKLDNPPYQVAVDIYVPINYGNVSRRKKKGVPYISWKEPTKDYEPTWDIGNLGEIWLKTFEDSLQISGAIKNDNIEYVYSHGPTTWIKVNTLDERKLIFRITEINK